MQRYYYGLDALRFFSAFAVCIFHLGFYVWASDYSSMAGVYAHRANLDAMTSVAWLGWVGVEIFFVISGFVIANSANGAAPYAFLQSRLLRLWPAAWVCATLALGVRLLAGEDFWRDLDANYLRSLVLWPKGDWIDGAYWSLAVEITFYALIFVLLLLHNFRRLPLLAWGIALVSCAYLSLAWLKEPGAMHLGGWFEMLVANADFLPIRYGVFFSIGIWIWMLSNRAMTPTAWIGLIVSTAFAVTEIELRAWELESSEAVASAGQPLMAPAIVWLLAVAFMIASTRKPDSFTPTGEATRARLRLAGKVTYPLYLVHSLVGASAMRVLIDMGASPYLSLVLAIAIVLGAAMFIAIYAEPMARAPLRVGLAALGRAAGRVRALKHLFRDADTIPLKPT